MDNGIRNADTYRPDRGAGPGEPFVATHAQTTSAATIAEAVQILPETCGQRRRS